MSEYSEFFLGSSSHVVQLELIDITHPNFTRPYYCVRNALSGVTVTLEGALGTRAYEYYPMRVRSLGARNDLDAGFQIDVGDLGTVLPLEMDALTAVDGFATRPTVVYRTYRSDDLTAPLFGPLTLEVVSFSFTEEGATFEAKAPMVNNNRTGELYKLDRFPMLRGFL